MLWALLDKVPNLQEQVGNGRRGIKILTKNQKEMLGIKSTVTELNDVRDGLNSTPEMAEERISELEDI